MPLGDWETALATLVVTRGSALGPDGLRRGALGGLNLTAAELDWLGWQAGSPGFAMTCRIQRWWREIRLRWAARLTLALLGPSRSTEAIAAYLDAVPSFSLFIVSEALAFLDFVLDTASAAPHDFVPDTALRVPHLPAVAHFERALLAAAQAAPLSAGVPPGATMVEFDVPPEALLTAILRGDPLPEPDGDKYQVLVSPVLRHRWQCLSPEEARLLETGCHACQIVLAS